MRLRAWVVVLIAQGRTLCLPSDKRRWAALPAEGFARSARWSALDLRLWPFEYIRRAQQCHYPTDRRYFACALQKAIVYPRRKLAYLHVYKAMGTTVEIFLRQICSPERESAVTCADAAGFSAESRVCSWGCTSNRTCRARPPPFAFTFVRDPVRRFVSAYQELSRRHGIRYIGGHKRIVDYPRAFHGNLSRFFHSLIDAGHFWNAHFMPQWLFLTTNQGKAKLSLDYIGHVNASTQVLSTLEAGLHPRNCSARCRSCVRDNSSLRRPFRCGIPQLRGPEYRHDIHLSRGPTDGLALTTEQTRTICSIYLSDYLAFGLPAPHTCTDILQRVRNGSYNLPVDFNPLRIKSRPGHRTVNGLKARGSGTVGWASLDWKQSLRRWSNTELNVSGTRNNPPLKLQAPRYAQRIAPEGKLHTSRRSPSSQLNISAARINPSLKRTKRPTTAARMARITPSTTRTHSTTRSNKNSPAALYNQQKKHESSRSPFHSTNQLSHGNTNTKLNISVTRRKWSLKRAIPRKPVLRNKQSTHLSLRRRPRIVRQRGAADIELHIMLGRLVPHEVGRRRARPSAEAEYIEYASQIMRALGTAGAGPVPIGTDNASNRQVAMRQGASARSKHLLRRYYVLMQRVQAGEVRVVHVKDDANPADFLTKWVPARKLRSSVAYVSGQSARRKGFVQEAIQKRRAPSGDKPPHV
ncbi:hypothetical protein AB1Y20_005744 [Prymnesium parvum]|uniref:Sulfotransferase n=1 Tax=Prymnesium parvum TaxID=97485 RepID=A0AB34J227_PRYPA